MASYDEIGSGGIKVLGCAIVTEAFYRSAGFEPNDIAYIKKDAQIKGKLTKIAVKKTIVDTRRWVPSKIVDTTNRLWFDYELVDRTTALALIANYNKILSARTASLVDNIPCP